MSDQCRRTPPWLLREIETRIIGSKFVLDAAASKANAVCKKFYDERQDGLKQEWRHGPIWVNPPFKQMGDWVKKAYSEARKYNVVICLVGPVGATQNWYYNYVRFGTIFVPNARIVYYDSQTGKPTHGADRDSCIYVVGPGFWTTGKFFKCVPFDISGMVVTVRVKT